MPSRTQVLEREVHPLLSGFFDTPFIVWLLKTRPEYRAKLFLEDQIGLNRHWLQMGPGDWRSEPPTLVTHYAGTRAAASRPLPPFSLFSPLVTFILEREGPCVLCRRPHLTRTTSSK